jgi:hypothetical protein
MESDEQRAARWRAKARPMPSARAEIAYLQEFSASEYAALERGLTPRAMEDKWVVFIENGVLRVVRSWTGFCIFEVEMARTADDGAVVKRAYANRDESQYGGDDKYDPALLSFLIDNLLLGRGRPFPLPPGEQPTPERGHGLLQHHLTGTGYREVAFEDYISEAGAATRKPASD